MTQHFVHMVYLWRFYNFGMNSDKVKGKGIPILN
jgi:hypothetical protein